MIQFRDITETWQDDEKMLRHYTFTDENGDDVTLLTTNKGTYCIVVSPWEEADASTVRSDSR